MCVCVYVRERCMCVGECSKFIGKHGVLRYIYVCVSTAYAYVRIGIGHRPQWPRYLSAPISPDKTVEDVA